MRGQPGQSLPSLTLPLFPEEANVGCSLVEESDEEAETVTIRGEIRAFSDVDVRQTVESVLREISAASALIEAILEMRVLRIAKPAVIHPDVLEMLAHDLRGGGFPIRFGRSWSSVRDVTAAVGIHGAERDLTAFFRGHHAWDITT